MRLRVAAYARVSSGKDAMLQSLAAQVSYYSNLIQQRPDWEYAGVYADEALTGTKDARPEFQRLIADCKVGQIDMVITKSISRFARNTVTLLETVRKLKMLGVDVYFEEQNIHSMNGDGELMLTILASYAQEESRSVSENCKWRIRKRFQQGEIVNMRFMYGYRINNGQIEIDQEQAEIVRKIYTYYINGLGCDRIAGKLRETGALTYRGRQWTAKRVLAILNNEKYSGNALLQKKYVADHLSKKLVYNGGTLPKYYVEGTHEPIIDPLTFQKAQEIMAERRENRNVKENPANNYPFSGLILCPRCGKNYRRVTYKGHAAWNCATFVQSGKNACPAKQIPEPILFSMTAEVLGLAEFDEEVFKAQIKQMRVPEASKVIYIFQDGREVEALWQDRSRKSSWDDEKKQQARERALAYQRGDLK
jgi:DNA invertase Pin-like site-specific DNA recombinase